MSWLPGLPYMVLRHAAFKWLELSRRVNSIQWQVIHLLRFRVKAAHDRMAGLRSESLSKVDMRKAQNARRAEGGRQRGEKAKGVPSQTIRSYSYQQTGAPVNSQREKEPPDADSSRFRPMPSHGRYLRQVARPVVQTPAWADCGIGMPLSSDEGLTNDS